MRQLVVFEEIRFVLLPLFIWYMVLGNTITIVRYDGRYSFLIERYRLSGRVTFVDWNQIDHQLRHQVDGDAIRMLEKQFNSWFKRSGLCRIIRSLYGTDDAEMTLKKSVVIPLKSIIQILLVIRLSRSRQNLDTRTILVPGQSFSHFPSPDPFLKDAACTIPLYARLCHFGSYQMRKIKTIALLSVYPFWLVARIGIPSAKQPEKDKFRTGIRIYETDHSFYQKYRSIDFLVDGITITAAETVFIPETAISIAYREELAKRGYNVLDAKTVLSGVYAGFLRHHLPAHLRNWGSGLVLAVLEQPLVTRSFIESLDTHLVWNAVLDRISINHYVVYNDTSPVHILRNIILRKNHVTSWYYVHSCGTANYFSPATEAEIPHVVFSYLYYDRFVTWNAKVQQYYEAHPLSVQKFERFGCLWSQAISGLARQFEDPAKKQALIRLWRGEASEDLATGPVIAVFDSTFGGEATLTPLHIIRFIDGILKLPDHFSGCIIVFKMKYSAQQMDYLHPESSEPDVHKAYRRLRAHPCCIVLDDDTSESAEVIAVSDLVISACFTSPTVEALGAGKKGMYFDADGQYRGTYYDQFRCMVSHDEYELVEYVKYWLLGVTGQKFEECTKKVITNEIDWSGDGQSVTRFRAALREPPG